MTATGMVANGARFLLVKLDIAVKKLATYQQAAIIATWVPDMVSGKIARRGAETIMTVLGVAEKGPALTHSIGATSQRPGKMGRAPHKFCAPVTKNAGLTVSPIAFETRSGMVSLTFLLEMDVAGTEAVGTDDMSFGG